MTASHPTANKDSVAIVRFYVRQTAKVSSVSVDGEDTWSYFNPALSAGFLVQPCKLVGNPAATLSKANYN
jgi:hypothetical protein